MRAACLEEASRIVEILRSQHRTTPDGGITWINPYGYGTRLNPLRMQPLCPHLYHGTTGVAVFLAALHRLQPDSGTRDLALRVLEPLRRKLTELVAHPDRAANVRMPLGGLIGLGSFLYGLVVAGELLEEPDLTRLAHRGTELVTEERISGDQYFRIQTGSAGLLLALLAVHQRAPGPNRSGKTALDLARACGHHLARSRRAFEGSPPAWRLAPGKPPLAGFSYGASGIAYALLRLQQAAPDRELERAAEDGLELVLGLHDPEHRGWRDLRWDFQNQYAGPRHGTWKDWWASGGTLVRHKRTESESSRSDRGTDSRPRFVDKWCHGTAGILLGLLGVPTEYASSTLQSQIHSGVERLKGSATQDEKVGSAPDDLCCGLMGWIEALNVAGHELQDPSCFQALGNLVTLVLERAAQNDAYVLSAARGTGVPAFSLFQGLSGVGYTLLRIVSPEILPCLLWMESPVPATRSRAHTAVKRDKPQP